MVRYVLKGSTAIPFIACDKCQAPLHCEPAKGKPLPGSKPGVALYYDSGEVKFYCKDIDGKGCDPRDDDQGSSMLDQMMYYLAANSKVDFDQAKKTSDLLNSI